MQHRASSTSDSSELTVTDGHDGMFDKNQKMKEVAILCKLHNRNLIKLHDYFTEEGNIYIITEFCSKGDLSKYLATAICLPKHRIWRMIIEITLAVAYLHQSGIIHCDLKPQNVFISSDNRVKVGDFSSAIIGSTNNHFSLYQGTPCYTAPEVYKKESFNNKVDIWSLGCIIYEL